MLPFVHIVVFPLQMSSPLILLLAKDEIAQKITSQWNGRSFGEERTIDEAIETYKLAYLSASVKKEKSLRLQALHFELLGYITIERVRRRKAISRNRTRFIYDSYSKGDYTGTQMSETRVLYLIAELSHQIGDKEEAVRNFSRVIESTDIN